MGENMNTPKHIVLYFKPTCPFCKKVLDYLEDINKTIDQKNVRSNPENLEDLKRITNKTQVPCLVVDSVPLLESDAIILWIEEHQSFLKNSKQAKF